MRSSSVSAEHKIWVAVGLALTSLLLALVEKVSKDQQAEAEVLQPLDIKLVQERISADIDSLVLVLSVQIDNSTKRSILPGGPYEGTTKGSTSELPRVEREVVVLKSFSTVDFNRRLRKLAARYDVNVNAKENGKLKRTSMELRHGDKLIETILLVAKK